MRTDQEIYDEYLSYFLKPEGILMAIVEARKEGRKEAIEECAEIAATPDHLTRQIILNLINELK